MVDDAGGFIEAIEEVHRESTNGGFLKRRLTHTDAQGNLVVEERDEASVLGLTLPAGSVLLNADGLRVNPTSGQLTAGTLTVQPGSAAFTNPEFVDQFGTGPDVFSACGSRHDRRRATPPWAMPSSW